MVLARIAVCEFADPSLVTNARSFSLSIWTVSLGARSSATTITGSSPIAPPLSLPLKIFTIRSEISFTSAALALK